MSREKSTIAAVLEVKYKISITPHYIRMVLTGAEVPQFSNTTPGVNNKILIPPPGVKDICFPEWDPVSGRWTEQPEAVRPWIRTFTHRGIDTARREMYIDFAVHGDHSPASAWALHAQPGDKLGVMMRDGLTELYPRADNYLLIGDATAIPVLGVILEDLPPAAKVVAVLEVPGPEDEQSFKTVARADIRWVYNPHPQEGSRLSETVHGLSLPFDAGDTRFGYVAAEYTTVKTIRNYLRHELRWQRAELFAYAYWKAGTSEDGSFMERHLENAEA
ncbi:siderophore-interacting protein [Chitinophaga solisilvae]|uniref:Siderophore-interacting protein n=1 Tax=Chitinophaga solisilvae TaxID=1233460 RepID=A0A3S1D395_9BACT|nr:siderophore-interacting protein [Chitinophaga solisilvae]NSL85958.1 siderophore-interacting protein [Chitinophaga solisilvae]